MAASAYEPTDRRPLASRGVGLFQRMASWMARRGWSPNAISIASIVFAVGGAVALVATVYVDGGAQRGCWLAAAVLIQCRLLANMFDGMLAIESGKASPLGELYNEIPDRVSDPVVLVGIGYAADSSPMLGYLAAVVALFVAYVRAMGDVAGAAQCFDGPMAKPQRMFVITLACLSCALAPASWQLRYEPYGWGLPAAALLIIIVGGVLTAVRRLLRISSELRKRGL